MKPGAKGSAVEDWQAFLKEHDFRGREGRSLLVDGLFGTNTAHATSAFQQKVGLPGTGLLDLDTLRTAAVYKGST